MSHDPVQHKLLYSLHKVLKQLSQIKDTWTNSKSYTSMIVSKPCENYVEMLLKLCNEGILRCNELVSVRSSGQFCVEYTG